MPSGCSARNRATGATESAATNVRAALVPTSDHSTSVSRPCSGESRKWRKKSPSLCQPGSAADAGSHGSSAPSPRLTMKPSLHV